MEEFLDQALSSNNQRAAIMAKKTQEGVPALQNDDVTGMTEDKQEEIIERSGRAPRKDAAEEFYEEQGKQARKSPKPGESSDR
jgi:hypothetical protein